MVNAYHKVRVCIFILLVLLNILVPQSVQAEDSVVEDMQVFVTPPSSPTPVEVALYLIGIDRISPPSDPYPTATVQVFMDLRWQDDRLVYDKTLEGGSKQVYEEENALLKLDGIWWPDIEFENQERERQVESRELVIYADGQVEYLERFTVVLGTHFDLHRFPHDQQTVRLDLSSFAWSEGELVFIEHPEMSGFSPEISLQEWKILGYRTEILSKQEIRSDEQFSTYSFSVDIQRLSDFYSTRVALPFYVITALSLISFFMDPEKLLSMRLQLVSIALLTLVAFQRIAVSYLPVLSYLTFLDAVIILGYLLMALIMVEHILIYTLKGEKAQATILRFDRSARWLVPLLFVVAMVLLYLFYIVL